MKVESGLSRRGFITGAALAVGGLAAAGIAGCAPSTGEEKGSKEVSWDEETDIVVVGCGGAGSVAAIEATSLGMEVIAFEKNSTIGGCSAFSGQAVWVAGSSAQKELGVEDSPEEAMEFLLAAGDGDEELLKAFVYGAPEAYDWLLELGMPKPTVLDVMPGLLSNGEEKYYADQFPDKQRCHHLGTDSMWPLVKQAVESCGADIRTNCAVVELVVDHASGAVLGVKSEKGYVRARKGVLLSAGGYSRNEELVKKHITKSKVIAYSGACDDGDGIKLGQSVGGGVQYLAGGVITPTFADSGTACGIMLRGVAPYGKEVPPYMLVNSKGLRFINERVYYPDLVESIMKQPNEGTTYVVTQGEAGKVFLTGIEGVGGENEDLHDSSDMAELAGKLGIDADALQKTADAFNAAAESSKDAFGRDQEMVPFKAGDTLYARPVCAGFASTLGGLSVDPEMRVLNVLTGQPIPNLYSAGVNAGVLGRRYNSGGMAVMMYVVTGRIAAKTIAADTQA